MMNTWNPAEIMERLNHLESIVKALPVTVIEANPEGEASTDLTKLTVGETIYAIPEATAIEANPEGEATVDLTKLLISETVYEIASGGITYSTTEFNTGKKWIDGRDIFGIVYDLSEAINVNYNAFTSLGITNLGSITIIYGFAISNTNYNVPGVMLQNDNGTLKAQVPRLGNVQTPIKTVYIEYIKPVTP